MEKPRFYFRLSEADLADLRKRARSAKKTPSEFARLALFPDHSLDTQPAGESRAFGGTARGRDSPEYEELVARLIGLEESVSEFRSLFQAAIEHVSKLGMASVAAAAMLKDDGKADDSVANKVILHHIDEALKVAPGLLRLHATKT